MAKIRIYSTRWCGYCIRAKALLESRGIEFEDIRPLIPTLEDAFVELSQRRQMLMETAS